MEGERHFAHNFHLTSGVPLGGASDLGFTASSPACAEHRASDHYSPGADQGTLIHSVCAISPLLLLDVSCLLPRLTSNPAFSAMPFSQLPSPAHSPVTSVTLTDVFL